jgi:hypothetical protein
MMFVQCQVLTYTLHMVSTLETVRLHTCIVQSELLVVTVSEFPIGPCWTQAYL